MKKKKTIKPLLGVILKKIAPKIGAKVVMEPDWHIVGQIIYKGGRKRYFRYSSVDLNPLGASEVAKDKDYANFFMQRMGYPIVPGSKTFYSEEWGAAIGAKRRGIHDAYKYAQKLGFPVMVKPNSGSQGVRVALAHTKREFYRAMRSIFTRDRVALVQSQLSGNDYRVVVLDGRVISAYQRVPLSVMGEGRSSIRSLLSKKQRQFAKEGRDTQIKFEDPRMKEKLRREGYTWSSVPKKGVKVWLLDNANLSAGGEALDVTNEIHPDFARVAANLTRDMGLRFCGVDLIVAGDIRKRPGKYWILEINAAPGLDHYVRTGKEQQRIVEDMYLEVLKSME
jgi:D-alanine-D-alanine ligase-like ATP-grasp enzyme